MTNRRIEPSSHQERLRSRMPRDLDIDDQELLRNSPSIPQSNFSSSPDLRQFTPDSSTYFNHPLSLQSSPEYTHLSAHQFGSESYEHHSDSTTGRSNIGSETETRARSRQGSEVGSQYVQYHTRRRSYNQDEFDGPSQLLPSPAPREEALRSQPLPELPIHLAAAEQAEIIHSVHAILSSCAFYFVSKYQFPIPIERDKPRVTTPADREWAEWAYLLKRLATKRRIPARVLFDNQIRSLVTTLENSIVARQNDRGQTGVRLKDDNYILQLISAGIQVAKILMDSHAMQQLITVYRETEAKLFERRARERTRAFQ